MKKKEKVWITQEHSKANVNKKCLNDDFAQGILSSFPPIAFNPSDLQYLIFQMHFDPTYSQNDSQRTSCKNHISTNFH